MEKEKIAEDRITADIGGPGKKHEDAEPHAGKDDSCRCKETAKMTPHELLRLMIGDLAFWKKTNKD
jgi:hypothetical protein